jgi:hypothetical protein
MVSRFEILTIALLSLGSLLGTSAYSAEPMIRDAAVAASQRIVIDSPTLRGSITLKGGRIDDIALVRYHETVDPLSPTIVLLSPPGSPQPSYAEFGWVGAAGSNVKVPGPDTEWRQEGSERLRVGEPVTLVYDNTAGLIFRRTISVDDKYLFTINDEVENAGTTPVTLYPYALVSREGTETLGLYVLHEGPIGGLDTSGLLETGAWRDRSSAARYDIPILPEDHPDYRDNVETIGAAFRRYRFDIDHGTSDAPIEVDLRQGDR